MWHYVQGGVVTGPVSFDRLCDVLRAHERPGSLRVWKRGEPQWRLADDVPDLAEVLRPPPPEPEAGPETVTAPTAPVVAQNEANAAMALQGPAAAEPVSPGAESLEWTLKKPARRRFLRAAALALVAFVAAAIGFYPEDIYKAVHAPVADMVGAKSVQWANPITGKTVALPDDWLPIPTKAAQPNPVGQVARFAADSRSAEAFVSVEQVSGYVTLRRYGDRLAKTMQPSLRFDTPWQPAELGGRPAIRSAGRMRPDAAVGVQIAVVVVGDSAWVATVMFHEAQPAESEDAASFLSAVAKTF